jgi:hypothetical protein
MPLGWFAKVVERRALAAQKKALAQASAASGDQWEPLAKLIAQDSFVWLGETPTQLLQTLNEAGSLMPDSVAWRLSETPVKVLGASSPAPSEASAGEKSAEEPQPPRRTRRAGVIPAAEEMLAMPGGAREDVAHLAIARLALWGRGSASLALPGGAAFPHEEVPDGWALAENWTPPKAPAWAKEAVRLQSEEIWGRGKKRHRWIEFAARAALRNSGVMASITSTSGGRRHATAFGLKNAICEGLAEEGRWTEIGAAFAKIELFLAMSRSTIEDFAPRQGEWASLFARAKGRERSRLLAGAAATIEHENAVWPQKLWERTLRAAEAAWGDAGLAEAWPPLTEAPTPKVQAMKEARALRAQVRRARPEGGQASETPGDGETPSARQGRGAARRL